MIKGMSLMSGKLFLRYWQKQCSNSFVLILFFRIDRFFIFLWNQMFYLKMKHFDFMYDEKVAWETRNWHFYDKWLISLDHVTFLSLILKLLLSSLKSKSWDGQWPGQATICCYIITMSALYIFVISRHTFAQSKVILKWKKCVVFVLRWACF